MFGFSPQQIVIDLVVIAMLLLVTLPFHEFAHALAAYRLGDSTARLFGRLTLDPRVHLDPVGALLLVFTVIFGFGLGWAKPTPVNPMNLRYGKWGEAIVAAAGPLSNLALAIAAAIPLRFILATNLHIDFLETVLLLFVVYNVLLMVFNLIPIPPLDGSKVLYALLDPRTAYTVRPMLEQYGPMLLLLLVLLPSFGGVNPLGQIFGLIVDPIVGLLTGVSLR
ncbi:MAG TPA: site-2 protease family protein [Candidatus Limnocylindrales bacterium]|jgi:Zn-dependent protease